jgi:sugar O-acyltransferase (sialic acid O-acetyltransferase NeuD family)
MKVAIFGGRGSGENAAHAAVRIAATGAPASVVGYLNDRLPVGEALFGGPVLGAFADWRSLPEDVRFVTTVHKPGAMAGRLDLFDRLGVPADRWASILDPGAVIAENARLSAPLIAAAFAFVCPGASIGRHVSLRHQAVIGHDVTIGDFVFVGAGTVVSGYCTLKPGAYLGPGSVVREGVTLGRCCVVGIGSTVVGDVPDYAVVAGNPARPLDAPR